MKLLLAALAPRWWVRIKPLSQEEEQRMYATMRRLLPPEEMARTMATRGLDANGEPLGQGR